MIQIDPASNAVRRQYDGIVWTSQIVFGSGWLWLSGGGSTKRLQPPWCMPDPSSQADIDDLVAFLLTL